MAPAVIAVILAATVWIPARLAWSRRRHPEPQAIFVLGGRLERFRYALETARANPDMPIVVSSGITEKRAQDLAERAGVEISRLVIDLRAVDTLTNFTCMIGVMRARGLRHVYMITSDYHMRRSRWVAAIVFGSRGIAVTPLPVASRRDTPERLSRALRDVLRALVWLVSGWDGQKLPSALPAAFWR